MDCIVLPARTDEDPAPFWERYRTQLPYPKTFGLAGETVEAFLAKHASHGGLTFAQAAELARDFANYALWRSENVYESGEDDEFEPHLSVCVAKCATHLTTKQHSEVFVCVAKEARRAIGIMEDFAGRCLVDC